MAMFYIIKGKELLICLEKDLVCMRFIERMRILVIIKIRGLMGDFV